MFNIVVFFNNSKNNLAFEEYSPLLIYHEGVPQCTSPQRNIMKHFLEIITSIAEP